MKLLLCIDVIADRAQNNNYQNIWNLKHLHPHEIIFLFSFKTFTSPRNHYWKTYVPRKCYRGYPCLDFTTAVYNSCKKRGNNVNIFEVTDFKNSESTTIIRNPEVKLTVPLEKRMWREGPLVCVTNACRNWFKTSTTKVLTCLKIFFTPCRVLKVFIFFPIW